MAFLRLDELPLEVLQAISYMLDASHKQSVASFSLVNQACRRAAAPTRFRALAFQIRSPVQLAHDVQRLTQVLLANDSCRSVRQLALSGDVYRYLRDYANKDESESFDSDKSWLPLAHLIARLSGLEDLYFDCNTSLPSCILRSLSSISVSRLHITNFRLEGLRPLASSDLTKPLELSAHDLELITSSFLFAIAFSNSTATRSPSVDYTPEAIFEIVARACPGLKEVEVAQLRMKASPRATSKKQYRGLKLDQKAHPLIKPPGTKAKLASLALRGRQPHLQQWLQHTDFDCLQVLKLTGAMDVSFQDWVANSVQLPSLKTLEIQTVKAPHEDHEARTTKILESLPGLKDLTIVDSWTVRTMRAITNKHGMTLQRLSLLDRICSLDELRELRDACPSLEHFAITIPRTGGDENEVAIYSELGSYPQIHSLVLNLDCTSAGGSDKNSVARRTLVNCAVDSILAASIFDHIANGKPAGSAPLESVELKVISPESCCGAQVYRQFTRGWRCGKHPRDDWRGGAIAVENKASQLAREIRQSSVNLPPPLGELEPAFRALWPEKSSGDWRDDWRSFPLRSQIV